MGKFKVLFGVKKGNPSWNEDVLLEGNTNLNNDKILKFAKNKYKNYGFVIFVNLKIEQN